MSEDAEVLVIECYESYAAKKGVFSTLLNTGTELQSQIFTGNVFRMIVVPTEKACFTSSLCVTATVSQGATELL